MLSTTLVLVSTIVAVSLELVLAKFGTWCYLAGSSMQLSCSFSKLAGSQTGETVKTSNTLCNNVGRQLQRHSDRNVPRTMFRKRFSRVTSIVVVCW
jgi:hypothetical protein